MYDVTTIRSDFPILSRQVNGKPLVYLDNGASAQKPQVVIDAVTRGYAEEYANVHRGLHFLSNLATDKYEAVRGTIQRFLNAAHEDEILFNTGATEGIFATVQALVEPGDEVLLIEPFYDSYAPSVIMAGGTPVFLSDSTTEA